MITTISLVDGEEIERNKDVLVEIVNALSTKFNSTSDPAVSSMIFGFLFFLLECKLLSWERFQQICFGQIQTKQKELAKNLVLFAQEKLRDPRLTLATILAVLNIVLRLMNFFEEYNEVFPVAAAIASQYFSFKNNTSPEGALHVRHAAGQIYRVLVTKGFVPRGDVEGVRRSLVEIKLSCIKQTT